MIAQNKTIWSRLKARMQPRRSPRPTLVGHEPRAATLAQVMQGRGSYTHQGYMDADQLIRLGYRAADFARSGGQQTVAQGGSADRHIRYDRETLIWESQRFDRDNSLYHGVINRLIDTVVGTGFNLQAQTGDPQLNTDLEALWKAWAKTPEIRNLFNWPAVERVLLRAMLVDGDVGAIKTSSGQLQLVESEAITHTSKYSDKPRMEQGVELDDYGRPLRYHVAPYTNGGFIQRAATKPIDAKDFLFLASLFRPSQTRGVPLFVPAFPTFHRLNDVLDSEAVAWQLQSRHALSITTEAGGGFGFNTSTEDSNKSNTEQIPDRFQELDYAMLFYGKKGEKVEGINRTAPAANFEQSVIVYLRIIGMTVGIPLELFLLDWSKTNYSSARAAIEQFGRVIQGLQSLLMQAIHAPVYAWKVQEWVNSHKITLPQTMSLDLATAHEWIAPEIPWVDPLKEATAWGKRLSTGLTTHTTAIKSVNKDRDSWILQRRREVEDAIQIAKEINDGNPGANVPWQMFCGVEAPAASSTPALQEKETEEDNDDEDEKRTSQ